MRSTFLGDLRMGEQWVAFGEQAEEGILEPEGCIWSRQDSMEAGHRENGILGNTMSRAEAESTECALPESKPGVTLLFAVWESVVKKKEGAKAMGWRQIVKGLIYFSKRLNLFYPCWGTIGSLEADKWHVQNFVLGKHRWIVENELEIGNTGGRKPVRKQWLPIGWMREEANLR